MNIIFLDIDGVLNSNDWYKRRGEATTLPHPLDDIDPECVKHLNKIIEETEAKVVVSSTWRLGHTIEGLQNILEKIDFKGELVGVTPHLGGIEGYTIPRGCEIERWLKEHGKFQRINWSIKTQREYVEKSIVKNYVILDDDSDMLLCQREHFVKTSWKDGLNEKLALQCIEILKTPIERLYYDVDWNFYDENLNL